MNPSLAVRWGIPDDALSLSEIHVLAWQGAYRGLLPDSLLDSLSAADRLPRWQERLAETTSRVLVAELDGQATGWLVIGEQRDEDLDPKRVSEIYAVYVHPDFWRHGCGAALITRAKAELTTLGYAEATLWGAARQPTRHPLLRDARLPGRRRQQARAQPRRRGLRRGALPLFVVKRGNVLHDWNKASHALRRVTFQVSRQETKTPHKDSPMTIIDLRSDTVTKPTPAMRPGHV
jgi:GNAT superfamily N-acetyltransferase